MTECKSCVRDIEDLRTSKTCSICTSHIHEDCAIVADGALFCDTCFVLRVESPPRVKFELPDAIRRTYIETYRSCPHKFFLEVIEGNEAPATCYTQIGIDLHELFDFAVNNRYFTIENMKEKYAYIWAEYEESLFDNAEQKEKMRIRADESINAFYEILPTLPMPFATEETIYYSIGDDVPKVRFTMDIINEDGEDLEIIDWKTGKVMVGAKHSSDLQAPLYIYGVQKHFNRRVKKFTFHYLQEGKTRVFEHIAGNDYMCRVGKREYYINLDDAIKEVKRLFSHIKQGNFDIPHDTSKMYFTCKMCHLQDMGLCAGADLQSWHQYTK